MKTVLLISLILSTSFISACNTVKPWERGTLAKEEMQFGANPLDDIYDDHIFFSKEASSGGRGLGGGGCGCN